MSFADDCADADFRRDAFTIVLSTFDGEIVDTIEVPELHIAGSELAPEWRALEEAQQ